MREKISQHLDAHEKNFPLSGQVLVARGDDIVFQKAFGHANIEWNLKNTLATRFRIASISKQFTATAILILEERGWLSLESSLAEFWENAPSFLGYIKVKHLLNHTSGLVSLGPVPGFNVGSDRLPRSLTEMCSLIFSHPPDASAGEKFAYSNTGYALAGLLIEKLTRQTFEDFISDNLLKKAGMQNTFFDNMKSILPYRASGYQLDGNELENQDYMDMTNARASGDLIPTANDAHLWHISLFSGSILSPESLTKMTLDSGHGYGLGLSVHTQKGRQRFGHLGLLSGFSAQTYYVPEERWSVVVLSNFRHQTSTRIAEDLVEILQCEKSVGVPILHTIL